MLQVNDFDFPALASVLQHIEPGRHKMLVINRPDCAASDSRVLLTVDTKLKDLKPGCGVIVETPEGYRKQIYRPGTHLEGLIFGTPVAATVKLVNGMLPLCMSFSLDVPLIG